MDDKPEIIYDRIFNEEPREILEFKVDSRVMESFNKYLGVFVIRLYDKLGYNISDRKEYQEFLLANRKSLYFYLVQMLMLVDHRIHPGLVEKTEVYDQKNGLTRIFIRSFYNPYLRIIIKFVIEPFPPETIIIDEEKLFRSHLYLWMPFIWTNKMVFEASWKTSQKMWKDEYTEDSREILAIAAKIRENKDEPLNPKDRDVLIYKLNSAVEELLNKGKKVTTASVAEYLGKPRTTLNDWMSNHKIELDKLDNRFI